MLTILVFTLVTPMGFVIAIIELSKIYLTSAQWVHLSTAYQDCSDNYMEFNIFLMSYGDDFKISLKNAHCVVMFHYFSTELCLFSWS